MPDMQDSSFDNERFFRAMEKLVNAAPRSLDGTCSLASLKNWDSLAILEFMVMADSDFNSDVPPDEVAACKTMGDLAALVQRSLRTAVA